MCGGWEIRTKDANSRSTDMESHCSNVRSLAKKVFGSTFTGTCRLPRVSPPFPRVSRKEYVDGKHHVLPRKGVSVEPR